MIHHQQLPYRADHSSVEFTKVTLPLQHINIGDLYEQYQQIGPVVAVTTLTSFLCTFQWDLWMLIDQTKYAKLMFRHDEQDVWKKLDTTVHIIEHELSAAIVASGQITCMIPSFPYSNRTQMIANEWPQWTAIREKTTSHGQQYINAVALEIDAIYVELTDIKQQMYLYEMNPNETAWLFCYQWDMYLSSVDQIMSNGAPLTICNTIQEFYQQGLDGIIIDFESQKCYAKQAYPLVSIITHNKSIAIQGSWVARKNAWDHVGILLNMPRLSLESNIDYSDRLKKTYWYVRNSSHEGLAYAIALAANQIKIHQWINDTRPLFIASTSILIDSIRLDGLPITKQEYTITDQGYVVLIPQDSGIIREVHWIDNIFVHSWFDFTIESDRITNHGHPTEQQIKRIETWASFANQQWGSALFGSVSWQMENAIMPIGYPMDASMSRFQSLHYLESGQSKRGVNWRESV